MVQTIYITVGFPGSGKSTWAWKTAKDSDTIIICKDNIRFMLKGDYVFDPSYEPLVTEIATATFNSAFIAGFNIIIDEEHITKKHRADTIEKIKNFTLSIEPKIICAWFIENKRNLEYQMKDPRGYSDIKWAEVIEKMTKEFQKPTKREKFDEIIKIPFESIMPMPYNFN